VTAEIEQSWAVIRAWLERAVPGSLTAVPSPSVEPPMPAFWPTPTAAIRAWWRCTAELVDGVERIGLLPPGFAPLSPQDAHGQQEMLFQHRNPVLSDLWPTPDAVQLWDREPAGTPHNLAWLPSWLPLGVDVLGGLLFADLRRGPLRGAVRSFFHDSGAGDRIRWPGVRTMLADVAAGLSGGVPVDGCVAHVDEQGRFRWRPAPQDLRRP
jgi:hypothetical protein